MEELNQNWSPLFENKKMLAYMLFEVTAARIPHGDNLKLRRSGDQTARECLSNAQLGLFGFVSERGVTAWNRAAGSGQELEVPNVPAQRL